MVGRAGSHSYERYEHCSTTLVLESRRGGRDYHRRLPGGGDRHKLGGEREHFGADVLCQVSIVMLKPWSENSQRCAQALAVGAGEVEGGERGLVVEAGWTLRSSFSDLPTQRVRHQVSRPSLRLFPVPSASPAPICVSCPSGGHSSSHLSGACCVLAACSHVTRLGTLRGTCA